MKHFLWLTVLLSALSGANVFAATAKLSPADEAAAFKTAGFSLKGKEWRACDPPAGSAYSPGAIEELRDINGDGQLDAIIVERSAACHGMAGEHYSIVSKQTNGSWKLMTSGTGLVTLLSTKGVAGWPDIEIGGPGFCFPVVRWNGRDYVQHRYQSEGKPCRPRF